MDPNPEPTVSEDEPIACSLRHDEAVGQLAEWAALLDDALTVERTDGVLSLTLPPSERGRAEDLASRERACCSFLTITVTESRDATAFTLRVESPAPEADAVVSFIGRRT